MNANSFRPPSRTHSHQSHRPYGPLQTSAKHGAPPKTPKASSAVFCNPSPTASSSNVTEFRCLFTHDIVRKRKRWQDGHASFHSFNRRMMLYDTSRNFIADKHWTSSSDPQEGDSIVLDRRAIIVELAEVVSTSVTDATPVLRQTKHANSTILPSPLRPSSRTVSSLSDPVAKSNTTVSGLDAPSRGHQPAQSPYNSCFYRHVPLAAVLGPQKGPYGRATLPTQPPSETHRAIPKDTLRPTGILKPPRAQTKNRSDDPSPLPTIAASLIPENQSVRSHSPQRVSENVVFQPSDDIRPDTSTEFIPQGRDSSRPAQPPIVISSPISISSPPHRHISPVLSSPSIPSRQSKRTTKAPKRSIKLSSTANKRTLSCQAKRSKPTSAGEANLVVKPVVKFTSPPVATSLCGSSDPEPELLDHGLAETDEMMGAVPRSDPSKPLAASQSKPASQPSPKTAPAVEENHVGHPKPKPKGRAILQLQPSAPVLSPKSSGPWTPESLYLFSWRPPAITDEMILRGEV